MGSIRSWFVFFTVLYTSHVLGLNDSEPLETRILRDVSTYTHNTTLRVTSILSNPYLFMSSDPLATGNDRYYGYIPDLLSALSKHAHFNYTIHLVKDGMFGSPKEDGKDWSGMIGEVMRGEADLAAAPLTIVHARNHVVNFIKPFGTQMYSIVLKKPTETEFQYNFNIMEPLSTSVWLCFIAAFIVVWIFMWLMSCVNPYEDKLSQKRNRVVNGTPQFGIWGSFWFMWTLTNWQGFNVSPRSAASRLMSSFWMLFVTFFLITYTGSAVNHLFWASTVHGRNTGLHPIRSLRDLVLRKDGYSYGTFRSGSSMTYFINSQLQEHQTMRSYWKGKGQSSLVSSNMEGVKRVRSEKYGYIMEEMTAKYLANQLPCDLMTVDHVGPSRSYGFALPLGSPYLDHFDSHILRMTESGDLEALEHKWFVAKGECWKVEEQDDSASDSSLHLNKPLKVGISSFGSALILLACGIVVSGVTALGELLYFKYKGRPEEHTSRQQSLVSDIGTPPAVP